MVVESAPSTSGASGNVARLLWHHCRAMLGKLHHNSCNPRLYSGAQASFGGLPTMTRMLPPIFEQLEGSSLIDHSDSRAQPARTQKKSVRFSTDEAHDGEITAHGTGPTGHATAGDRDGGGEHASLDTALAVNRIDHGDAASAKHPHKRAGRLQQMPRGMACCPPGA